MSFGVKVDEDLPSEVADVIRSVGYDARTVMEQGHLGSQDDMLWTLAQAEGRMFVTADKGFADLRIHPPGSHAGVVLFRLPQESRLGYVRLAETLVREFRLDDLRGTITVVSPTGVRVHRAGAEND